MMNTKREYSTGSVTPTASGYRARLPSTLGRRHLGVFPDKQQAEEVLAAALQKLTAADVSGVLTVRKWGERYLRSRELAGVSDVGNEGNRWATHIDTAPFADDPLDSVQPAVVFDWVDALQAKKIATPRHKPRKISRKTVAEIVNLLSGAYAAAVARGLCATNPVASIRIRSERRTYEPWTYLEMHEQMPLIASPEIPECDRLIIEFALGTGLREGEQFNLYLLDVHADADNPHIIVRHGSADQATKSDRIRRVELFGHGLRAAHRWLEILPSFAPRNPLGLMFPTPGGARRSPGKNLHRALTRKLRAEYPELRDVEDEKVDMFRVYLARVGIIPEKRHDRRPVRWHDLRHTCASSLVAGWWGEPWRVEDVMAHLGHSSITMTQRYAHLAPSRIQELGRKTRGGRQIGELGAPEGTAAA